MRVVSEIPDKPDWRASDLLGIHGTTLKKCENRRGFESKREV
jgi:hypothetical protein